MIDQALTVISHEINQHLKLRFNLNEDKVVLSSLMGQDGKVAIQDQNKVICSLFDLSEESTVKNATGYRESNNGMFSRKSNLYLNLYILFASYFTSQNYTDALKYLSEVIAFFHAKPLLDKANSPSMTHTGLDTLKVEIYHQDASAKNNLWSMLGAKYMPSITYKISLLVISDDMMKAQIDGVRAVDLDKNKRF